MLSHNPTPTEHRVLLVNAGEHLEPVPSEVMREADSEWLLVEPSQVIPYLRSEPFGVIAIVVSGDGESEITRALLDDLKEVAPRLPIVFLDERDSASSEVRVRQAGVHYYGHAPVPTGEISAVLDGLSCDAGLPHAVPLSRSVG